MTEPTQEPIQEKRQHNILSRLQDAQLANYMAGYTESGLTDEAFAAKATEALGFTVSESNIRGWRYELKLAANKKPRSDIGTTRKGSREEVLRRLETLEQAVQQQGEALKVITKAIGALNDTDSRQQEHLNGQAKRMDDIENHVAGLQKYIAVLQSTLDDETMRKLGAFRTKRP